MVLEFSKVQVKGGQSDHITDQSRIVYQRNIHGNGTTGIAKSKTGSAPGRFSVLSLGEMSLSSRARRQLSLGGLSAGSG